MKESIQSKKTHLQIAYFILVHRLPNQFKRLFHAIYAPEHHYIIHIDKRSSPSFHKEITDFLSEFQNVHIIKSEWVLWGGYSMVQAELSGMLFAVEKIISWDFFINLSGQDFPLRSQSYISTFLWEHIDSNFIQIADQKITRPETMNRIENYFEESENWFIGAPYARNYMENIIPYIGGQWMILTRNCCEFLCTNPEVRQFEDYYTNTLIPDEWFFQTVLMNTSWKWKLVYDDKRAIIWIPDIGTELSGKNFTENETTDLIKSGKIKLRPKTLTKDDFPFIEKSDALFARKFDESVDSDILDRIEKHLIR